VDRYDQVLALQVLSWGPELWREVIVENLVELTGIKTIYERSDVDVRELEGLPPRVGLLAGEALPQPLVIEENGLKFVVGIEHGHKTGFYLDQRTNRKRIRQLSAGKEVLDCFSFTGGFTLNALAGGADHVTVVDASWDALEVAKRNVALNDFELSKAEFLEADVFAQLRKFRDMDKQFDLIILDPPKFAPTKAQVEKASRGYKDINLLAFKLLRPGGTLATFSCSGGVNADLFQKIVYGAALDAEVNALILERLTQDKDHPVSLNFPEGEYLKGLVCWIAT
jgi:23S rRNA (cytosine1962-C5)-methyltransferase